MQTLTAPTLEKPAPRRKTVNGAALPADLQGFTAEAWGFAAVMQEWLQSRPQKATQSEPVEPGFNKKSDL